VSRHFTTLAILLVMASLALLTWAGQQRPPDPYLQAIQARGVLRVGLDPTVPPFDTLANGRPSGYDVALAQSLASDLGLRPEYHTLALDTLYDALASDQVDVLISALPFVYERQKEVRYSVPYYQSGQVIVVRPGNTAIRTASDLANATVAVELGSNSDTEARRLQRNTFPTLRLDSTYHSAEDALAALIAGRAEAAITGNLSAQTYASQHPHTLIILQPPLTDEPYVVAMPAGADALATLINSTIERLRSTGDLARMMGLGTP
jgi:polar amino acid transport system substrate-binding protein